LAPHVKYAPHPSKALWFFLRLGRQQTLLRPPHLVSAGEPFSNESRLAVGGALNAELAHPVAKGVGMEIQNLRGAVWPIHHSTSLLKGGLDMASLYFLQGAQSRR
jgi:hypothetical protein